MSDMYCVYMHRNKINNKKYIGITKQKPEDRWRHGLGYKSQQKFYRAIEKYGWNNFDHIILNTGLSAEEAGTQEQILISLLDTYYNGYNATLGGDGQSRVDRIKLKELYYDIYAHILQVKLR